MFKALATKAAHVRPSAAMTARGFTSIRDAGGSFAKKEAAQEDQYAREHDKEVIAKLREQLTKKHQAPAQTPEAAPAAPPSTASSASTTARDHEEKVRFSGAESSHGGSIRAGGGALGKKEAADEERYIKELEKERNARKKSQFTEDEITCATEKRKGSYRDSPEPKLSALPSPASLGIGSSRSDHDRQSRSRRASGISISSVSSTDSDPHPPLPPHSPHAMSFNLFRRKKKDRSPSTSSASLNTGSQSPPAMSRTSSVSSTSSSRSATPSAAPSSSSGVDRQPATSPQQPASPNRSSTATSPKPYMIPAGSKAAATAPVVTAESARAQAAKPAAAVAAASPSTPTKADALSPQPPPKITLTAPSPSVPPKTTRGGRQPVNPLPHDYHLHGMVRAIRIPVTVWIIGYSTLSMLPRAVPGGEAKLHATHVPGHVTMALTRGDLAYEPLFLLSGLSVGLSLEESTVEGQGMPGTWELVRIWGRKLGEVVPVVLTTLGAVGLEMLLNDGQVGVRGRERWGHLVAVILDCQFYLVAPWVFKYLRLADRGASPRLVLSGSLLSGLLALLTTQHLGLTLPQGLPHLDRNIATGLQVPFRFPSFLAGLALSVERHRPAAPGAVKKGPSALNQGLGFAAGLAIWSWLIWGPPVGEGAGFVEAAWRAFRIPLASVAGYFCLRPLMAVPADVALETPWRRRVHDVITHPVVEAVGLVTFAAEMVHREVVLGVFTAVRTSGWLLDDQGRVSDGRVLMAWGGVAVCSGLIGFGVYKVLQAPFMGFFRRRFEKKAGKGPKAF